MKVVVVLRSMSLVALISAVSCSEPLACGQAGQLGVVAHIRDAVTGRPAAYQARLILRSDTRVDTFPDFTAATDSALAIDIWSTGVPGEYTVTVERDGYMPWIKERVLVLSTRGACSSVSTVVLDVNLLPL